MATPQDSIFSSPPFKFLVGPDQKPFTIHVELVATQSKPLAALVTGKMSEAKEECARLEEVDEGTFGRFIRYAYTGDYSSAKPVILLDPSSQTEETSSQMEGSSNSITAQPARSSCECCDDMTSDDMGTLFRGPRISLRRNLRALERISTPVIDLTWSNPARIPLPSERHRASLPSSGRKRTLSMSSLQKKVKLWREFRKRPYSIPLGQFEPPANLDSNEDFTEVFLSHARLYALAELYDIAPLHQLCLHKLHRTLTKFTLYHERRGDIIKLMRYTYMNTPDLSESMDPLRSLIVHYATYHVEDLSESDEFNLLLGSVGQLGRDMVYKMIERLD